MHAHGVDASGLLRYIVYRRYTSSKTAYYKNPERGSFVFTSLLKTKITA
jgi:hypothetical protein